MLRNFIFITCFLTAGCDRADQLAANFQYSNAGNLGTQNAGLYEPGSLFLWNTNTNELSFIDVIDLARVGGSPAPADIESSNVSSVALGGVPLGADEELLRVAVGAQSSFSAKSAVREDYGKLVTALARYATELRDSGVNPDVVLRPRDAGFRLILVRSVLRAEDAELRIGGVDASQPDSVVSVEVGAGASFELRVGSSTSCTRPMSSKSDDVAPACFFNVAAFDPEYLPGNPRLQFPIASLSAADLSSAFRALR